jgi:hypothetical protein
MFRDQSDRPHPITKGEPLWKLLGDAPATFDRCPAGGDMALVPPYDDRKLLDSDFHEGRGLVPVGTTTRAKGWQAAPIWDEADADGFVVRRIEADLAADGAPHVRMGFGLAGGQGAVRIEAGARLVLTQQVRAPLAGGYTLAVEATGGASSADYYRNVFLKHFTCRLVLFGYGDLKKDLANIREYASLTFEPPFAAAVDGEPQRFELFRKLRSQDDGAYELSRGIGVAVFVEKTSPSPLELAQSDDRHQAFVRIHRVTLEFNPRPRDDSVTV